MTTITVKRLANPTKQKSTNKEITASLFERKERKNLTRTKTLTREKQTLTMMQIERRKMIMGTERKQTNGDIFQSLVIP